MISRRKGIRFSREDRSMYALTGTLMIVLTLIIFYPIIYVLSASFSDPIAVSTGQVVLWPIGINIRGYEAVFAYKNVLIGYRNTIFYTVVGTFINVTLTMFCAYPLSRKDMQWKKFYMIFFLLTMYFSGGLIPTYILISKLQLTNTVTIMMIGGAVTGYFVIIARTFLMQSIPNEILESVQIDGGSDFQFFIYMVIPLSSALIAVLTLFYAVGHWNSYFSAMIYLSDSELYPLQLFLRQILVMNQIMPSDMSDPSLLESKKGMSELLKYSLIIVSTAPILCVYPFIQRYFVKGVMIGSVKG